VPVATVNELVRQLIVDADLGVDDIRLYEADREDSPPFIRYHLSQSEKDQVLSGTSNFRAYQYLVIFVDEDGADAESTARAFEEYVDGLGVNVTYDTFVVQGLWTNEATDEERQNLVSDVMRYGYLLTLTLAIGRTE
jgi:hypothetical protein